jgi:flagellar protein FliJ
MNSSQRLKPIKKLADNKEKIAAQDLGKSVEQKHQNINKLSQLIEYRAEYVASMGIKTQQGISGDLLHQYHQFLTKLDTAIEQQKLVVSQSEQMVTQSQEKWRTDNSRASAISKVIKTIRGKEIQAKDKKESAQMDEMSTQAFLRRKN